MLNTQGHQPYPCRVCRESRYEYTKSTRRTADEDTMDTLNIHSNYKTCNISQNLPRNPLTLNHGMYRNQGHVFKFCIFVLLMFFLPCCHAGESYYPQIFNAALNKKITIIPDDGTCGSNGQTQYCRSFSDPSSVTSCWEGICDLTCPFGDSLPFSIKTFTYVREGLGDCVMRNNTLRADGSQGTGHTVYFTGSGTDSCYLTLTEEWLVPVALMPKWNITVTVWLRPQIAGRPSTILSMGEDIMRFFIDEQSRIAVSTGSRVITHNSWTIPLNQWSFVAIQVQPSSVTVFLHGIQASEAIYDVTFQSPSHARQFRVGQSFRDGDPFVGLMQDLEIYTEVLTNREIVEVYSGVLPETRIQTDCRCPPDHPLLKPDAEIYCVANYGQGRPDTEMYRLSRMAHPSEFINDDAGDTEWISSVGNEGNMLEIPLDNKLEVSSVQFQFYSPPPASMIIERRPVEGGEWEVWQYYSRDCQADFSLLQNGALAATSDINCLSLIPNPNVVPYTGAIVTFDPLQDRPGRTDGLLSAELKAFTQAHAIRVSLRGHPYTTDARHKYHGVSEIGVYARCDCNGHGTSCDVSQDPYVCTCAPESHTQGRTCDTCVLGAFVDTTVDVHSPERCRPCDCNSDGTVNGDITCDDTGGQCSCKPHVTGRSCDVCEERYFNLQASNEDGCDPCSCDDAGTTGDTDMCNGTTGQCACKSHVTGQSCDQCVEGFFGLDINNPDGCTDCQCHTHGTVDGAIACHQETGQCQCKAHVTGRLCDQCMEGTYGMDVSNAEGCTPCGCDPEGAHNSSCDATSGHCYCKPHVVGTTCDQCEPGYYALDHDDFKQNGCQYQCDCDPDGTTPGQTATCGHYGGQCACKTNVQGRRCVTCTSNSFGFNSSEADGCLSCDCDPAGTLVSSGACDVVTGQCNCKDMVEGRKCDLCVNNTFALNASNPEGCQPCNCYEWGAVPGSTCNIVTGHCLCIPGAGDASLTGYTCTPYISSIEPAYGPESGGTVVTVRGGYLGGAADAGNITIQNYPCDVDHEKSTQTELVCITRAASHTVLNRELPVHFFVPNHVAMDLPDSYMYKQDPIITDVYPLSTIKSGGIMMTVIGEHFDYVQDCVLDIFLVHRGNVQAFSSKCETISPRELNCPTPAISLPEERRKRDLRGDIMSMVKTLRSRVRRSEDGASENRDVLLTDSDGDMFFYFGFRLDGVEEYVNMTGVLPNVGPLKVYSDPEFEMFEGADHLEFWRPYWPFNDKQLTVRGKRLDLAATIADYHVSVGKGSCELLDMYTNQLHCTPPAGQPDADESGTFQNAPSVTVHVGNIHNVLGYLKYEMTFWDTPAFRWGIIGSVAGLLCAIILLVLLCHCCCRASDQNKKKKHPFLEMETNKHTNPYMAYAADSVAESSATYMNPESDLLLLLPEDLRDKLKDCLIEPKRMSIGKSIGQGHYGRVYLGTLYDERITSKSTIAIKTLREFHVTPRDVSNFLEEATMMKDFKHVHVLHLMGVVIDDLNRCYVLLPYMENGDMKAFISNEGNMLTVGELINFGLQIADGMVYLSHHKFVHRDLAARNCMIDKDLVIKIADFGLSRDLYERDYYKNGEDSRPLPVKWMSLESLEHGIYTTKSDVWSFGVLLWELMTRGCTPYPDVDPFDIKTYIMCGNRMDKPDFAPTPIYQIMLECWDERPDNRPTFSDLIQRMSKFLESSTLMRPNCNRFVRPRSFQQMDLPVDLLP